MKQKVKDEFGDEIIITQLNGKHVVVNSRGNISNIIINFYEGKKWKIPNLKQCASFRQLQN